MSARGLRIIAGSLRGRRLPVPCASDVRPTPERVREALFSIVGERVIDAAVLDAYAGSGALGFEALSRGASRVLFVDSGRGVVAQLRASAAALGVEDACTVQQGRLPDGITGNRIADPGPFDLVLADPPYAMSRAQGEAALKGLAEHLETRGLLVWERSSRDDPIGCSGLDLLESRRFGNTAVDLFIPLQTTPGEGGPHPS